MTTSLKVLHVDPEFVVVEKPAGLLSVPGRGPDKQDCVVRRIRELFPDCPQQPSVHRLDMDTSGLMVLARTVEAHRILSRQFAERRVHKKYLAVLVGVVGEEQGRIELAFRLDPDNRPHQIYDPVRGKSGVTRWRRVSVEDGKTRVEFIPLTGRTHQLRLHAAHSLGLGCPIVGDRLYGTRKPGERMLLHAAFLQFLHPRTEEVVELSTDVPF
ncbi:MAG: RluA family pseudouridine synthase [Desulfobulbaceae bacterium]|nr:RluA family pseudouridine synthase [Desulfobulbaceae bacterium]